MPCGSVREHERSVVGPVGRILGRLDRHCPGLDVAQEQLELDDREDAVEHLSLIHI